MMQPNFFAMFSVAAFPLLVVLLFYLARPPVAVGLSFIIGEMYLPPNYVLPLSSPTWLGKLTVPPMAVMLVVLLVARSYTRRTRPFRGIEWFFVVSYIGIFMTMMTNRDPLHYGPSTVQGEAFGDFTSMVIRALAGSWMAFYLGRIMFKTSRDLVSLCRLLIISTLIYSLLALFEVRMSPSLMGKVFGFNPPYSIDMAMRWGGWRPSVFFGHGIALTAYFGLSLIMLIAMTRARRRIGPIPMTLLCLYLTVVIVLCKSTGAIFYAAVSIMLLTFVSPRRILAISTGIIIFFLAYPLLRFSDFIPTQAIGNYFTSLSADRAQSLSYRFDMEQGMLDLTRMRPWFGWGGYGRNFVYDPVSGHSLTVVDGMVIEMLSAEGLVGYFAFFGPLAVTVLRAARLVKKVKNRANRYMLTGLTLACSLILFDLIINAVLPPVFILVFGALYGLPTGILAEEQAAEAAAEAELVAQDPGALYA
jgi:hypothetical protein